MFVSVIKLRTDSHHKTTLNNLINCALDANLKQVINFDTWSCTINGITKMSMLDHIYVNNIATVNNVKFKVPTFGDHILAIVQLKLKVKSCIYSFC